MIRKLLKFSKISFLALAIVYFAFSPLVAEPVGGQASQKSATPISPDTEINPGDRVRVEIRIPGARRNVRRAADTELIMDVSGSMNDTWRGGIRKLDSAKAALNAFVALTVEQTASPGDHVGLTTYPSVDPNDVPPFNEASWNCNPPTSNCAVTNFPLANMTPANRTTLTNTINGLDAFWRTPLGSGIDIGTQDLQNRGRAGVDKFMIIASDGVQTVRPTPFENGILTRLISSGITVYTVGIGDDVRGTGTTYHPCTGCRDIDRDGIIEGEDVLKDVACQTDPACNKTMPANLGNLCDPGNPASVNDMDCPRNYFFAASQNQLEFIYEEIINNRDAGSWFQIIDRLNTVVYKPFSFQTWGGTTINTGDPLPIFDCSPGVPPNTPWPSVRENQYLFGSVMLITLESIRADQTACIRFTAVVRDATECIQDNYGFYTGIPNGSCGAPNGHHFGDVVGNQRSFSIDDFGGPSALFPGKFEGVHDFGIVDPGFTCDMRPPFGTITFADISACRTFMLQNGSEITPGQITVVNPAKPWVQTTRGSVGSQGAINMERNPAFPAIPEANTSVLGIASGLINNFQSAKTWLVPNYASYGGINLGDHHDYNSFLPKLPTNRCTLAANQLPNAAGRYIHNGNLTFATGNLTGTCADYATDQGAMVFVQGNLNIDNDLTPAVPTVIFVSGNVNIHYRVRNIDAVIVADGSISTGSLDPGGSDDATLVVDGALIGGLSRNPATHVNLERDLPDDLNTPAERINLPPEFFYYFRETVGVSRQSYQEVKP